MPHNRECRHMHDGWTHIFDETYENRCFLLPTEGFRNIFIDELTKMSRDFDVEIAGAVLTPVGWGFMARFKRKNQNRAMQRFKSNVTIDVNDVIRAVDDPERAGTIYRCRYRDRKLLDDAAILARLTEFRVTPARLGFAPRPDEWFDVTDDLREKGAQVVDITDITGHTEAELDEMTHIRLRELKSKPRWDLGVKPHISKNIAHLEQRLTSRTRWPLRYGELSAPDGITVNRFCEAGDAELAEEYAEFRVNLGESYNVSSQMWECDVPPVWPDETVPRGREEISERPREWPDHLPRPPVPTVRELWADVEWRPPPVWD